MGTDDDLPQGEEKAVAVEHMFNQIAPRYDLVNRLMTFRMDVGWRRRTVKALDLAPGSVVLDLACGTGDFCNDLLRYGLEPVGLDFSAGMLGAANTDAPLIRADALCLPVPVNHVDGITCGFALRNFTNLSEFFEEISRVLKPGGRIGLLDVAEPSNPLLRLGHSIYFGKIVPKIGALLSDQDAYKYLPKSVQYLPDSEELLAGLRDVGFSNVGRTLLSGGITQLFVGTLDE
ncbi:MAG: ubiquinone/menaquinone biosynthesis methyltransferase [Acidimicrobiales bacterium]|jgi:demethylmenaquinone methyltransferase/2-methoxy-6-polyprenyl-1,4-benzoquinol methylase|nr:ubiquinone/menaquinone biosynthesis methyltransferase [Acidimicrobiales bacterium]MDP6901980.1 ubiquinone/menaquinone biosynthesis methyltransferase [Acidimicrobiales bacterium]HJL98366.1 ubiquinone/menaquinone biosynthesis methyltransferase [Acidimicrobiales bacterium]